MEKPKNLYFRGLNPKKVKIPVLLYLLFQNPAIIPPPPLKLTSRVGRGGGAGSPSYMRGIHCPKTLTFPLLIEDAPNRGRGGRGGRTPLIYEGDPLLQN